VINKETTSLLTDGTNASLIVVLTISAVVVEIVCSIDFADQFSNALSGKLDVTL
jgi:hypothetical protein